MPTLLKNIRVQFISLVKAGANRRGIIAKFAENPPRSWEVSIAKTDRKKQMVYGVVYAPDEADTQGDYTTAEEIEKASQNFMKSLSLHNIDRNHSGQMELAWVAESWIIRKGDPMFPREKSGAWAVGIRVDDPDLWADVEAGKIRGLSMGGTADKIIEKDDEAGNIMKTLKNFFRKQEDIVNEEQIKALIMAMLVELGLVKEEGAEEQPGEEVAMTKSEMITVVKTAIEPMNERIKQLEAMSTGSVQDGKPIKKGLGLDPEALGAEIAAMIGGK